MESLLANFEIEIFKKDIPTSLKFIEWLNRFYLTYSINQQIEKRINININDFGDKTIKELEDIFYKRITNELTTS
jgi:hypothetical protein